MTDDKPKPYDDDEVEAERRNARYFATQQDTLHNMARRRLLATVDALRAQLAEANAEADSWRAKARDKSASRASWQARAEKAEAKLARVGEALSEGGAHAIGAIQAVIDDTTPAPRMFTEADVEAIRGALDQMHALRKRAYGSPKMSGHLPSEVRAMEAGNALYAVLARVLGTGGDDG